jgi:hypothetical protein
MFPEARERSFDELAKGLAEGSISRRRALKLFAGTVIGALVPARAFASSAEGPHGAGGKKQEQKCICHRPPGNPQNQKTLCLPKKAAEAHLKNHPEDTWGPCSGTTSTTTTPTTSTSTSTTSTTTTPMCLPLGSNCTAGDLCCVPGGPGIACNSQIGTCCIPNGNTCTADTQCCSSICTSFPSNPGFRCSLCRAPTSSCAADTECCSDTCEDRTCRVPEGRGCTNSNECCFGLTCDGGLCHFLG